MKKKNIIPLLFIAAAIVFEILPYGAKLTFALDGGKTREELFSYFSLTPYGYANFLPFITAVLTCALLVLAVVILFKDFEKLKKAFKYFSVVVFVMGAVSLLTNLTVVAALIAASLAFNCLCAFRVYKA
ncbi:MAG: hypothetical protein IJF57_03340 [Clostridia bacterium]|nr:hypothetical protein [Clostridia bacterium]